jgi:endo-1,4-beta-xylanase
MVVILFQEAAINAVRRYFTVVHYRPVQFLSIWLSLVLIAAAPTQEKSAKAVRRGALPAADEPPQWVKPPIEAIHTYYKTFSSRTVGGDVSYLIYLPPGYEKAQEKHYPVTYWLHGRGGAQTGIPALVERLTKAIEAGKTPPMIVVFVNGLPQGGYMDSADGKQPVESYIIRDLIPHIDQTYRTIASSEGRLVEGFSMGGSGAARFGVKYPELFGTIGIFAGALHDADSIGERGSTEFFEKV